MIKSTKRIFQAHIKQGLALAATNIWASFQFSALSPILCFVVGYDGFVLQHFINLPTIPEHMN